MPRIFAVEIFDGQAGGVEAVGGEAADEVGDGGLFFDAAFGVAFAGEAEGGGDQHVVGADRDAAGGTERIDVAGFAPFQVFFVAGAGDVADDGVEGGAAIRPALGVDRAQCIFREFAWHAAQRFGEGVGDQHVEAVAVFVELAELQFALVEGLDAADGGDGFGQVAEVGRVAGFADFTKIFRAGAAPFLAGSEAKPTVSEGLQGHGYSAASIASFVSRR